MSKTVFITGASSGIGKATALYFQKKGWNVAATMRSPEKTGGLSGLPNLICPRLDVTDPESIKQAIIETVAKFGDIDVVLNNAGYAAMGIFENTPEAGIRRQFETNVFGLYNVIRAVLPRFRAAKRGVIVNVASIGGRIGFPLYSLYNSTKWAVEGFSECLRQELAPFNIKVKVIEPGAIKTDFYSRSLDKIDPGDIPEYKEYSRRIASKTDGTADSVAVEPAKAAAVIYRAATDKSGKFRYPAKGGAKIVLFLRKILPDALFFAVIKRSFG